MFPRTIFPRNIVPSRSLLSFAWLNCPTLVRGSSEMEKRSALLIKGKYCSGKHYFLATILLGGTKYGVAGSTMTAVLSRACHIGNIVTRLYKYSFKTISEAQLIWFS